MIEITMLKVMNGHDTEVYRVLKSMKYVKEAYYVLGEFPIFVIMQADDQSILDRLIDTIKECPYVTGIWHILVSNDDNPSKTRTGLYKSRQKARSL